MPLDVGSIAVDIKGNIIPLNADLEQAKQLARRKGKEVSNSFNNSFSQTARRSTSALKGIAAAMGVTFGAAAVGMMTRNVMRIGAVFEEEMTAVGGVARATAEQMQALTDIAEEMGRTTEYTATQSARGLRFLAMAGLEVNQQIVALPGVLDLATAGQLELSEASDIATNAMTAFGLRAEELTRVNDVFVATTTRSNTNVRQMADAFKYAAPTANALGYSIEELSAMIGVLGSAGIQGSMAGTQLAFAMQQTGEFFEKTGTQGEDLIDVLNIINKRQMTANEILDVFGQRGGRAILVLRGLVPEYQRLLKANQDAEGESRQLAETMRNTVANAFREVQSAIQAVAITAFGENANSAKEALKALAQTIRDNEDSFAGFISNFVKLTNALIKWGSLRSVSRTAEELGELYEKGLISPEQFIEFSQAGVFARQKFVDEVKKGLKEAEDEFSRKRPEYKFEVKAEVEDFVGPLQEKIRQLEEQTGLEVRPEFKVLLQQKTEGRAESFGDKVNKDLQEEQKRREQLYGYIRRESVQTAQVEKNNAEQTQRAYKTAVDSINEDWKTLAEERAAAAERGLRLENEAIARGIEEQERRRQEAILRGTVGFRDTELDYYRDHLAKKKELSDMTEQDIQQARMEIIKLYHETLTEKEALTAEATLAIERNATEEMKDLWLGRAEEKAAANERAEEMIREQTAETMREMEEKSNRFADRFSDVIIDLKDGSKSLKEAFGDMANAIVNDFIRMTMRALVFRAVVAAFGGGGGGGVGIEDFGDIVNLGGSAEHGAVFKRFQSGGSFTNSVVKQPTLFPVGEMGEAGPEAIMPLENINGDLGVRVRMPKEMDLQSKSDRPLSVNHRSDINLGPIMAIDSKSFAQYLDTNSNPVSVAIKREIQEGNKALIQAIREVIG